MPQAVQRSKILWQPGLVPDSARHPPEVGTLASSWGGENNIHLSGLCSPARPLRPRSASFSPHHSPHAYMLFGDFLRYFWLKYNFNKIKNPRYFRGFPLFSLARPEGFEPPAKSLEGSCSVQLSYGRGNMRNQRACKLLREGVIRSLSFFQVPSHACMPPARHPQYDRSYLGDPCSLFRKWSLHLVSRPCPAIPHDRIRNSGPA